MDACQCTGISDIYTCTGEYLVSVLGSVTYDAQGQQNVLVLALVGLSVTFVWLWC